MKPRGALLVTLTFSAVFAGSRTGRAEPTAGFYIGGAVGLSLLSDQPTTLDLLMGASPAARLPAAKVGFGGGFSLMASAGYAIGNGLRFEVETDFRQNGQARSSGGEETKYGVFANAVYDADLSGLDVRWVTPYLGVGIGYQVAEWSKILVSGEAAASADPITAAVGGSTGNFAYQIIAGLAFPIDEVAGLSVTAEYRFLSLSGTRGYSGTTGSGALTPSSARARAASDSSHSFLLGLRYAFDAEPADDEASNVPAPPPQQLPASRTYIVYFDVGSVALTPHSKDVIAEAARASGRMSYTRIEVSGHTDRAGTTDRNIALSEARSEAVADEMVRWGILRSAIDIHAFGEERPAVQTVRGVREARNRRVEIVYR
jgi:outer membrane protein OmpA-like peptidoglycan-associated protein